MIKTIEKTPEKAVFTVEMDVSLANAIRRSVNEIPILAIDEVDIYKNDSALYDPIIAHRIGLVPIKNSKVKAGQKVELKLKAKGGTVLSGEMGKDVVYDEMPIVLLEKDQELEAVAKGKTGTGNEHSKFSPGLFYYRYLPKIDISGEGEKHSELAEMYPKVFEFDDKLKVKNDWECDLDDDDLKDFKGVNIKQTKELVILIESWGQIPAGDIFTESIKALKDNLNELSKSLK